jgi:hypothetical protein
MDADGGMLPPVKLSPDSVIVETVLVRFPFSREEELSQLWRLNNETFLDIQTRRHLDRNGMRAGIMLGELPALIRAQLEDTSKRQVTDAMEHAGLAADVDNKMHQLCCRGGRRKDLMIKHELLDPITVLSVQDDQRVTGETYEKASLLFDLRAIPNGDGTATLELTPEIQHGEHRQSFESTDFGVRPQVTRSLRTRKDLKVSATLRPGQVLMLAGTLPPKSLGAAFFVSQTAEQSQEHVLLLIRISETQLDALFAPDELERAKGLVER